MEININSEGSVSEIPERAVLSLVVKGYDGVLDNARVSQEETMKKVREILSFYNSKLSFISPVSVQELSHREECTDKDSKKVTRYVRDSYCYYQSAEVVIDNYKTDDLSGLVTNLSTLPDCNVRARFELTETQKSEMYNKAMDISYNQAVEKAIHLAKLHYYGFYDGSIKLKEASLGVSSFDDGVQSERSMMKAGYMSEMSSNSAPEIAVKKMSVRCCVQYKFTV